MEYRFQFISISLWFLSRYQALDSPLKFTGHLQQIKLGLIGNLKDSLLFLTSYGTHH
ncbi:hypothetical protein HanRHA438_Chr17g0836891 [Helianthus annuus]|nr:hypothetical protein HanRHA438_Chr17g0836891 [Helianthus annuus]